MIFATYQHIDYLTYKNRKFSKLKQLLGLSEDTNLYWCISANNIYQAIINSFTIEANVPHLFVMFETNNFYKMDAIKWNYYVETQDENLLTEDLFVIEHEDAIEYLVTEIPDKRFEVCILPDEFSKIFTDKNHKYYELFYKYNSLLIQPMKIYPSPDELKNMPVGFLEKQEEIFTSLHKFFLAFKNSFLIPFYIIGMDYLGHPITEIMNIQILSWNEFYLLLSSHYNIYANCRSVEDLYNKYKNYYQLIYKSIFMQKKTYPNEPCPCGSGIKYKKCCMNNNKVLYKYMTE